MVIMKEQDANVYLAWVYFDEKIVSYKPPQDLTFDIVKQPRDPEIMGHIDILRGQFI